MGDASDYDTVLAETRRLKPDVVLMDIKMPPTHSMEGIDAAHIVKEERPDTGVVVLSQHEDEGYVWGTARERSRGLRVPPQGARWRCRQAREGAA